MCKFCETCKEHRKGTNSCVEHQGDLCISFKAHQDRPRIIRHQYQTDINNSKTQSETRSFAVEMQKVLLLPKMTIKDSNFVSQLTVFNEIFAELSGANDLCLL